MSGKISALFLFLFLFLFSFLFAGVRSFECPNGSQQVPNENVCIYLVTQVEFYWNAIRSCEGFGGIPIKIQNVYENSFTFIMCEGLNNVKPYIGVERNENDNWIYADGSPLIYQNWAPNEPNQSSNTSFCAVMDPQTGKWISAECTVARPFFCSFDGSNNNISSTSATTTLSTPHPTSGGSCADGWVHNEITNACYFLQNFTTPGGIFWQTYNVSTAEAKCRLMGAHLVSIHSKAEDDFVYELIVSNVKRWTNASDNPCTYGEAWIGYFGMGAIGNGSWTDGTPVDYVGGATMSLASSWAIFNDQSCSQRLWEYWPFDSTKLARFVCKMPAMKLAVEMNGRNEWEML